MNNKYFMAVPNDIMNTKHSLHYELLNFDTNIELKLFISILAQATMIFRVNKNKKGIQTFLISGILGKDSFIPRSKNMNHKKVLEIINQLNSPFFDVLSLSDKQISFQLSAKYIKTLKSGFTNVNLMDLKKYKSLKATKLAILTTIYPNGYLSLNYLFKYLKVKTELPRTEKIRQIKTAFDNLDVEWEYKHPAKKGDKELPEHYKFHYKTIKPETDIKSVIKANNNAVDKTFDTSELDLNINEVVDKKDDWELSEKEIDEQIEQAKKTGYLNVYNRLK